MLQGLVSPELMAWRSWLRPVPSWQEVRKKPWMLGAKSLVNRFSFSSS